MYLLDTNIISFIAKSSSRLLRFKMKENADHVYTSSICVSELAFGAEKSNRVEYHHALNANVLNGLKILDFDIPAANETGKVRNEIKQAGTPVGPMDVLIAAHARSLGFTLITNNVREFERIERLRIEDWTQ